MTDFQLASGRAKRPSVPATSHDTAGFVLPDGTRFTVGNTISLTAGEIASPTAEILADTSATYIGPSPGYPHLFSIGTRLVDGSGRISAAALGLKFDGTDESTQWQNAVDSLYSSFSGRGGTIVCPDALTSVLQGLWWPAGISIVSESGMSPFAESDTAGIVGTILKLPTSATTPLLRTDRDVNQGGRAGAGLGVVRNTGIDGLNQRYHGGSLRGVFLQGSQNVNNHTAVCDLLNLMQVWNVSIDNVSTYSSRGFGIRALDCNTLTIRKSNSMASPWFFESAADSVIRSCQVGNGNGLATASVWLANACFKSQISELMAFNNQANGARGIVTRSYAFPIAVVGATGTGIFTSQTDAATGTDSHFLETDTPVMMYTTGALPTGFTATAIYYVFKRSANTFTLCTQRSWIVAGVVTARGEITSFASAGSNNSIVVGPGVMQGYGAALALTNGSARNAFTNIRCDQAFGTGLVVDNSPNNSFTGLQIAESAFGNYTATVQTGFSIAHANPTPQAGVTLRNSATGNVFSASNVLGDKTGTLDMAQGFESRQKFGFDVDSTSRPGLVIEPSAQCSNHTAANSAAGAANLTPRDLIPTVIVSSADFEVLNGAAIALDSGGRRSGWVFDATTEEIIQAEILLPYGWLTVEADFYWTNNGAGSGGVAWFASLAAIAEGVTVNAADGINSDVVVTTAGAQNILMKTTVTSISLATVLGAALFLRVKRVPGDAGDTLANDVLLHAVHIRRLT